MVGGATRAIRAVKVKRSAWALISSAVLVQVNGWARSVQPSVKVRILALRSRTLRKLPRWMAWPW
jgi:hypothetical protein